MGPHPDIPLGDMTDMEVLARSQASLARVASLPVTSPSRVRAWAEFDAAQAELNRRMIDYIIERLGQR